jgi:hypothetical protein
MLWQRKIIPRVENKCKFTSGKFTIVLLRTACILLSKLLSADPKKQTNRHRDFISAGFASGRNLLTNWTSYPVSLSSLLLR